MQVQPSLFLCLALVLALSYAVLGQSACGNQDYVPSTTTTISLGYMRVVATTATFQSVNITVNYPSCSYSQVNVSRTLTSTNATTCLNTWLLTIPMPNMLTCMVPNDPFDVYAGSVRVEARTNVTANGVTLPRVRNFEYPFNFAFQSSVVAVGVDTNTTIEIIAPSDLKLFMTSVLQEFVRSSRTANMIFAVVYNSVYRLQDTVVTEMTYGRNVSITSINSNCVSTPGYCTDLVSLTVHLGQSDCFFSGQYNLTFAEYFPGNIALNVFATALVSINTEDVCALTSEVTTATASIVSLNATSSQQVSTFVLGDPVTYLVTVQATKALQSITIPKLWLCKLAAGTTTSSFNCFTLAANDPSVSPVVEGSTNLLTNTLLDVSTMPSTLRVTHLLNKALLTVNNADTLAAMYTQPYNYRVSAKLVLQYKDLVVSSTTDDMVQSVAEVEEMDIHMSLSDALSSLAVDNRQASPSNNNNQQEMTAQSSILVVAPPAIISSGSIAVFSTFASLALAALVLVAF